MSDPASVVLHAGDHLRARYRPAGAPDRPLVVTFDSLNADLSLDRAGFGEAWLAQIGLDAVHVVSDRNAWYLTPETGAMTEAVRKLARERGRTVTYGSSMGGYAAVRLADAVGAQAAVALSPQASIDPAKTPFEDRWSEYAVGLDFTPEAQGRTGDVLREAFVVYDPHDRDRRHMELLSESYPVVPVALPHAGHPAGTFLMESDLLADMVRSMIEGVFDPGRLRTERRAGRRRSGQYHHIVASRLAPRRSLLADQLSARAVELQPRSAAYLSGLAERLERAGDLNEAEAARRGALRLDPLEPRLHLRLAELLLQRDARSAEAVELATGVGRFGAQRTAVYAKACEILVRAGAFAEARDEARAALGRLPHSRELRRWAFWTAAGMRTPLAGRLGLATARRALTRAAASKRSGD